MVRRPARRPGSSARGTRPRAPSMIWVHDPRYRGLCQIRKNRLGGGAYRAASGGGVGRRGGVGVAATLGEGGGFGVAAGVVVGGGGGQVGGEQGGAVGSEDPFGEELADDVEQVVFADGDGAGVAFPGGVAGVGGVVVAGVVG